jgi:hypothetical protein
MWIWCSGSTAASFVVNFSLQHAAVISLSTGVGKSLELEQLSFSDPGE